MTSATLKIKVVAAAIVPVFFFLLLFLTIIILCCACVKHKNKNVEIEHEKDKLEQLRDIIDSLKGQVPQQYFPEFLRFSEKILISYCSTPQSGAGVGVAVGVVMKTGEVHLNLGEGEELDNDSIDFKEEEGDDIVREMPVPKQVLKAVTNTVRVGLSHPHIGRRLHRQLSTMLSDVAMPTTTSSRRTGLGAQVQSTLISKDGGYNSRSTSGSSAPDN